MRRDLERKTKVAAGQAASADEKPRLGRSRDGVAMKKIG